MSKASIPGAQEMKQAVKARHWNIIVEAVRPMISYLISRIVYGGLNKKLYVWWFYFSMLWSADGISVTPWSILLDRNRPNVTKSSTNCLRRCLVTSRGDENGAEIPWLWEGSFQSKYEFKVTRMECLLGHPVTTWSRQLDESVCWCFSAVSIVGISKSQAINFQPALWEDV